MFSPRQALEQIGSYNGEQFEKEEKLFFDSYIIPISTAITDQKLFQSDSKDRQYKNTIFPLSSTGALITKIRIYTDIELTPSHILSTPADKAHLIEASTLRFTIENKIVGEYPFWECLDWNFIPANFFTAGGQLFTIRNKMTNWFVLDSPLKIGAGKQVDTDLLMAKGLTSSAAVTDATPTHYNAGLTSNVGFIIKVYLKGYLFREAKAAA